MLLLLKRHSARADDGRVEREHGTNQTQDEAQCLELWLFVRTYGDLALCVEFSSKR